MASTVPEPPQQPQAAPARSKRHPWGWIVACAVLLAAAIALGVWALSAQSDLDDEKDKNAAVEKQLQATQDDVQSTQQDVQAVSDQVEDLGEEVSNAGDELSTAANSAQKRAKDAVAQVQASLASLGERAKAAKDKLEQAKRDAGSGGQQNANGEPQS